MEVFAPFWPIEVWARALGIAAASVPLPDLFPLPKKACFTCAVKG